MNEKNVTREEKTKTIKRFMEGKMLRMGFELSDQNQSTNHLKKLFKR